MPATVVLCFGHPLLDMMADVSNDFLKKHNIVPGSVELAVPSQIPMFTYLLEKNKTLEYVPGGSSMNTARGLCWTRPNLAVYYVGCLGKDRFGSILKTSMSAAGVRHLFEESDSKPTGTCAALVCDHERSLVANLGAAVELSMNFMESPEVQRAIEKATVYYSEGFFMNTASSPGNLLSVARHAHSKKGKLFCFNLNAPYLCVAFKDRITALLPEIDILFASDADLMGYACAMWPKEFEQVDFGAMDSEKHAKVKEATTKVGQIPSHTPRGFRIVVITCGSYQTVMWDGSAVLTRDVPPLSSKEMVDLNGAGDSFVAGFLSQFLYNQNLILSADVGHKVAQNCIRNHGATLVGEPPILRHQ